MAEKNARRSQESRRSFVDNEMLSILTRVGQEDLNFLPELNLSLCAQSDQNFEWILVLRPSVNSEKIKEKIDFYWAKKNQVVMLESKSDSRGGTLNIGLEACRGKFFTVLDSDDLAFDHFVSVFNKAGNYKKNATKILRAQVGKQIIKTQKKSPNQIMSMSSISFDWPEKFDLSNHLIVNQSPCHSLAFPIHQIRKRKIEWDPTLESVEDWDFLTNALQFLEVLDISEITGIYRQGKKNSRSALQTKKHLWNRSESAVRLRIILHRNYNLENSQLGIETKKYSRIVRVLASSIPSNSLLYRISKVLFIKIRGSK
jgi:glycosyltransferase involved in cell wall biosynthesis